MAAGCLLANLFLLQTDAKKGLRGHLNIYHRELSRRTLESCRRLITRYDLMVERVFSVKTNTRVKYNADRFVRENYANAIIGNAGAKMRA